MFESDLYCLNTIDSKLIESIDYSVCVDMSSGNNTATLHVTRDDTHTAALGRVLAAAGRRRGVPTSTELAKVRVPANATWQHEMFVRAGVPAATLSNRRRADVPPTLFGAASLLESRAVPRADVLFDLAAVAMATAATAVYGEARAPLASDVAAPSEQRAAIERRLAANARVGAALGVSIASGSTSGSGVYTAATALATALSRGTQVAATENHYGELLLDGQIEAELQYVVQWHTFTLPDTFSFTAPHGTAHVFQGNLCCFVERNIVNFVLICSCVDWIRIIACDCNHCIAVRSDCVSQWWRRQCTRRGARHVSTTIIIKKTYFRSIVFRFNVWCGQWRHDALPLALCVALIVRRWQCSTPARPTSANNFQPTNNTLPMHVMPVHQLHHHAAPF